MRDEAERGDIAARGRLCAVPSCATRADDSSALGCTAWVRVCVSTHVTINLAFAVSFQTLF